MAVQRKDDETVDFSWIVWPDRATRDAAMKKATADPRMKEVGFGDVFDGQRMVYGGFETILSL